MRSWTVVMLLEGGAVDVTLHVAHVNAVNIEEAVLEAWAVVGPEDPTVLDLHVFTGHHVDQAGPQRGMLLGMLNG